MQLRPLTLKDKPLFDEYARRMDISLSNYAFAPLYIWEDHFDFYWVLLDDYFCVLAKQGDDYFMPIAPVGETSWSRTSGRTAWRGQAPALRWSKRIKWHGGGQAPALRGRKLIERHGGGQAPALRWRKRIEPEQRSSRDALALIGTSFAKRINSCWKQIGIRRLPE